MCRRRDQKRLEFHLARFGINDSKLFLVSILSVPFSDSRLGQASLPPVFSVKLIIVEFRFACLVTAICLDPLVLRIVF